MQHLARQSEQMSHTDSCQFPWPKFAPVVKVRQLVITGGYICRFMLLQIDAVAHGLTASSDHMSVQHNHQSMIWLLCMSVTVAQA